MIGLFRTGMAGKTYASALVIRVSRCNIGSKDTKSY